MVYAILMIVTVTTRERMLNSTVALMQQRGANAVTVDAVLAHSGAPRGSVYHHFPGGRDEMVLAALNRAADIISARLQEAVAAGDTADAVDAFITFWKASLRHSDFTAGCPVMAVAVDGRSDIRDAGGTIRAIFGGWLAELEKSLRTEGRTRAQARRLATITVAAIEGALILARTAGSVRPLDDVAAELRVLLRSEEGT
jgi:AcrR family transcriptional regulator